MGKARDQAGPNWIGDGSHDDRDDGRGALRGTGRDRSVHDDHIDFALYKVSGQFRYSIVIAIGRSPLDHQIASLGVPRIPQPLPERLRLLALLREEREEDSDV